MSTSDLLAQVPLFADLGADDLGALAAAMRQRQYRAGEPIFRQGDPGTALYIIEDGEVKLVLGVLLELAQARGKPGAEGVVITSRLTQNDLADMVGATRESVNKWLRYYTQRGFLRHDRGQLTLLNPQALRADLL